MEIHDTVSYTGQLLSIPYHPLYDWELQALIWEAAWDWNDRMRERYE